MRSITLHGTEVSETWPVVSSTCFAALFEDWCNVGYLEELRHYALSMRSLEDYRERVCKSTGTVLQYSRMYFIRPFRLGDIKLFKVALNNTNIIQLLRVRIEDYLCGYRVDW